jgi:hypothetical protein
VNISLLAETEVMLVLIILIDTHRVIVMAMAMAMAMAGATEIFLTRVVDQVLILTLVLKAEIEIMTTDQDRVIKAGIGMVNQLDFLQREAIVAIEIEIEIEIANQVFHQIAL